LASNLTYNGRLAKNWIPASAGMTMCEGRVALGLGPVEKPNVPQGLALADASV